MNQYLIQWASGAFQIVTAEQLKKDLDEYQKAPPRIYRLIPNQDPKRLTVVWGTKREYWYLEDAYGNHLMIL